MRSRSALFALFITGLAIGMPHLAHASIPYWGPIIPNEINQCPANWAAIILVANNIISFLLTFALAFVAPIMFAYAGFLYVVNPVNPSGRSHANEMMMNIVIGIVIALASWLIVDTLLSVLYNGSAGGPWYSLITGNSGSVCINVAGSLSQSNGATDTGSTVTGIDATGGKFLSLPTNGNCKPGDIHFAASAGGYNLTESQADTLSCIAVAESSCGTNKGVATTPDGKTTSANGMFQVVLGINDTCHNLNLPVCTQAAAAAGYSVSGNLNCSTAFSGGKPKPGMDALAKACQAASANLGCNASAAACLIQASPNSPYGAWTADSRSSTQQNCVARYATPQTSLLSWITTIL